MLKKYFYFKIYQNFLLFEAKLYFFEIFKIFLKYFQKFYTPIYRCRCVSFIYTKLFDHPGGDDAHKEHKGNR